MLAKSKVLGVTWCCRQAQRTLFSGHRGVDRDWIAIIQQRIDLRPETIRNWLRKEKMEMLRDEQQYINERHSTLGPNLATAHFMIARGAQVKFVGQDYWVKKTDDNRVPLPNKKERGYNLEAVDASGTELLYEGFDNFINLEHLRYLNLSGCPHIDDWCLDRFQSLFSKTLVHLDLSGCPNVTERGLAALHKLSGLRRLLIQDMAGVSQPELTTLLLEEVMPNCEIVTGLNLLQPDTETATVPRLNSTDQQTAEVETPIEADLSGMPGVIVNKKLQWWQG